MRKLLFILAFLPSVAFAGGPKWTYPSVRGLDDEMNNVYHDLKYPIIINGTASTFTVTSLSLSTMTACSSCTMTNATIVVLNNALMSYRRPVLVYNSGTVVNIETGLDGTSGDAQVLFPDGTLLTDSTAGDIQVNLAQVAAFASGTIQSGLRTGTVAANTWYAIYAVKVTKAGNTNRFVGVVDTVLPTQANFSTLNSNFGTNGWVYLGMIANGDNSGSTNAIVNFVQVGNKTILRNVCTGTVDTLRGIRLATGSATTAVTWTYASGTSIASAQLPNGFSVITIYGTIGATTTSLKAVNSAGTYIIFELEGNVGVTGTGENTDIPATEGFKLTSGGVNTAFDIQLISWIDNTLGVGSNPLL